MSAPTRINKKVLINKLVKHFGYSEDDLESKKRQELVQLLKCVTEEEESKGEGALTALVRSFASGNGMFEDKDDDIETEDVYTKKIEITPQDPGWTQYVLGQFTDDELDGKNPRVEGLRRVAEALVGDIIEEGCDLVSPPTIDNGMRACAKAWFVFATSEGERTYAALADACDDNCLSQFKSYPTAMADTRAKGRCLRNALKLRRVVAAEEIDPANVAFSRDDDKEMIDSVQITAIHILSERKKVSIKSCLKMVDKNETADIESITKGEAKKILSTLQMNNETKETVNA